MRDANKHGSERYRKLLALYRENQCPAPEFHRARTGAVHEQRIGWLGREDLARDCFDILAEKTRLDELVQWSSVWGGQMSPLRLDSDEDVDSLMRDGQNSGMSERASGLGSLFEVRNCPGTLSPEEQTRAKEVHRAPLRYARRQFLELQTKAEVARTFGVSSADDLSLDCDQIVRQVRLEEDNRVYNHGTYSRTITGGGTVVSALVGAMLFGEAGAALGLLLDAQTMALAKRMTKREGRLLDDLNRRSCYFEFAVNPEQQEVLGELVEGLSIDDRSLPCEALGNRYSSSMSRLVEIRAAAGGDVNSPYLLFWWGRTSGALSDRDAGLMILSESRGCEI